jgi:heme-degrading monooxygenase HmoA
MFAVIFRAKPGKLSAAQSQQYSDTVARMRELAFEKYGCLDFIAATEGDTEIAISYWPNEAAIIAWKSDPEHNEAQQLGRNQWYDGYTVQVVEIKREYQYNNPAHSSFAP